MNTQYQSALTHLLAGVVMLGLWSCSASPEPAVRQPSNSSELGMFMKTHVNPSFSKISFLLFHDGDSDSDLDPSELPASASALAQAAERLTKWPDIPGDSAQGKLVFTEYAAALNNDARNLVNALRDGKPDSTVKAFESLRKKCDACHHFFRYDETSTQGGGAAARSPGKP